MKLKVVQGYYAPKINNIIENEDKIHCVVWPKCNFRCSFCDFWQRDDVIFKELSIKNFEAVADHLIKFGRAFKFTGGEPCLNPELFTMLQIVKNKGGLCFLDTNGSFPQKVKKCIDAGLIDVLAISLKGLDADSSCKTAGIVNEKLCWSNVMETISYAASAGVRTIVTYVIYGDFSCEELERFAHTLCMLGDNIYLKINNLMPNDYNGSLSPVDHTKVTDIISRFIDNNPCFAGRVIYIGNKKAVTDIEYIKHY